VGVEKERDVKRVRESRDGKDKIVADKREVRDGRFGS